MIEVIASSFVPRKPSPKFVKAVWIVRMIGTMRNTARKKVPGNMYFAGTKRFVEYRTKIASALSTTTASHIHILNWMSRGMR